MRFTIASVALLASFVAATPAQTVYTTEDVTITSCAPTVTNCPARSSTTVPSGPAVTTSAGFASAVSSSAVQPSAPAVSSPAGSSVGSSPAGSSVGSSPAGSSAGSSPAAVSPVSSSAAVVPPYPSSPAASISVITLTTCVPTVTYSTITLSPSAAPTGAASSVPGVPAGTGVSPAGTSSSVPPTFTGAASSVSGSFALAGVAAVAAVMFA